MAGERRDQLIRAFIALEPGEDNLPGLIATITRLGSGPQGDAVRWVRPENLHVTLRFLGNIPESSVEPLQEAVSAETWDLPAFDLSIGPAGLFPRGRRPRVVAAALLPEQPLAELAQATERGVRKAGLPGEERTFRPHLTLGRIRRNAPRSLVELGESLARVNDEANTPAAPHRVTQVSLYRSDLKPDGPVYSVLWSTQLAGI